MSHIEIKDFGSITHCEIEVKHITILIGQQAVGKSVIAKACYFFKEFYSVYFEKAFILCLTKTQFEKDVLEKFQALFPRYTWEKRAFSMKYTCDEYSITIWADHSRQGRTKLNISYSKSINDYLNKCKKEYKKLLSEKSGDENNFSFKALAEYRAAKTTIKNCLSGTNLNSHVRSGNIFIPASRSFFANLQKNIFTFLASNIEIDPLVKEFGKMYESLKRIYLNYPKGGQRISGRLKKIGQEIIKGEYTYEDDKDWITGDNGKINLANASSGQQEAIPMLIVLCSLPYRDDEKSDITIFIEEPEAHLFPSAQKSVVSMLSIITTEAKYPIFITTHSPYILSAINILITAGDVDHNNKKPDITSVIGNAKPIRFEDVAAYNITKGRAESIVDQDNRLIGVNIIDEVSDIFDQNLDALLQMQD